MSGQWQNWSEGVQSSAQAVVSPGSVDDVISLVSNSPAPIRPAGSGHSFTPLVASRGTIVETRELNGLLSVDPVTHIARVAAGTTIRNLGPLLFEAGLGLINQGDIDRQTLAGAIGTGTHGTGAGLGSLSASVTDLDLVLADGTLVHCSQVEQQDLFSAARVSMGTLGIVTEIGIQCRPAYGLCETGGRLPIQEVLDQAERLKAEHRHFEFFWFPLSDEAQVKFLDETETQPRPRRRRPDGETSPGEVYFERLCSLARFMPFLRGPIQRALTEKGVAAYDPNATGRVRWSHDAFPSDRNVRFNEMEYAVPAERGLECLQEVGDYLRRSGHNFVFPIEFRYVKGDDIWISPFYGRDSATISIHQYYRQSYSSMFRSVEEIFRRYDGRPHWGKLHTLTYRDFEKLYPRWTDFCDLRARVDPDRKFLTLYLSEIFCKPVNAGR